MYYIVTNAKQMEITYIEYGPTGSMLETQVRRTVNRDDAIEVESLGHPLPTYFREATNVEKLLIIGGKIHCKKINGRIESLKIMYDFPVKYIAVSF